MAVTGQIDALMVSFAFGGGEREAESAFAVDANGLVAEIYPCQ